MATINWDWGADGYELLITTRVTDVRFVSDLPTSSMDVQILRGLPEAAAGPLAPSAAPAAALTPPERNGELRYTYDPVQIKVHIWFADEGTMRIHLNINSAGEVSTIRQPGIVTGNPMNAAKGVGKGTRQL